MRELAMQNGRVTDARPRRPFEGMVLVCTGCEHAGEPERRDDDPKSVCRCAECGKKHSTDALEVA